MAYFANYSGRNIKAVLTFKDGSTYEAFLNSELDAKIKSIGISESEAKMTSSLLGMISSNNLSIEIIDTQNKLNINNSESEYFGMMGSDVKVEVFQQVGQTWVPKGVYYTDTWSNAVYKGTNNIASLYCYDRLSFLGNKQLSDIGDISGTTAGSILAQIFTGLGLVAGTDYVIESGLDFSVAYSITKGSKVRDTLNEIAKALIARINCDRSGVIRVKKAFSSNTAIAGVLKDTSSGAITIKNNTDTSGYRRVKVDYINISEEDINTLAFVKAATLSVHNGLNTISGITLPMNTRTIDAVIASNGNAGVESSLYLEVESYTKGQDGLSVVVRNNTAADLSCDITVKGRNIITSNASVYNTNGAVGDDQYKTFQTENVYIQNKEDAVTYANNVKLYIDRLSHRCTIGAYIDMDIQCGTYIEVESDIPNVSGTYYVNGLTFDINTGYKMSIDAILYSAS